MSLFSAAAGGWAVFTSVAGSRREFLPTGGVWSRDAAVRVPPVQLASPGSGSVRFCLPCAPGYPRHDFIFWPKRVCSCFTACFGPGINLPANVSLWLSQICLLGAILYITLCCQPHLQPGKLTAPAGSKFFPRERAQV